MWELYSEVPSHFYILDQYPAITYQRILILLTTLILLYYFVKNLLLRNFGILRERTDTSLNSLELSPFYHLAIIILLFSEMDWNMLDLSIWALVYIGVGIFRKAIFNIKYEKQSIINAFSYDTKLIRLLYNAKFLGILIFAGGITLFLWLQLLFTGISIKVSNLLVFPLMIMASDGLFLFLSSAASEKDILCYFNQNINQILPTYKLELVQKITSNSIRMWHYYNLLRLFIKTLIIKIGIFEYIWVFSVVNAGIQAITTLYISMNKFRNYNKLMNKFDRLFRKTTSAPEQNCTICLTELLNCRQLSSCGHLFHYRCLFQWMQTKAECPICRIPIPLN